MAADEDVGWILKKKIAATSSLRQTLAISSWTLLQLNFIPELIY